MEKKEDHIELELVARRYYRKLGQNTPSIPLARELKCSQKRIYDAFRGRAHKKLKEIKELLKDLTHTNIENSSSNINNDLV